MVQPREVAHIYASTRGKHIVSSIPPVANVYVRFMDRIGHNSSTPFNQIFQDLAQPRTYAKIFGYHNSFVLENIQTTTRRVCGKWYGMGPWRGCTSDALRCRHINSILWFLSKDFWIWQQVWSLVYAFPKLQTIIKPIEVSEVC
jgi:hypothetical protein